MARKWSEARNLYNMVDGIGLLFSAAGQQFFRNDVKLGGKSQRNSPASGFWMDSCAFEYLSISQFKLVVPWRVLVSAVVVWLQPSSALKSIQSFVNGRDRHFSSIMSLVHIYLAGNRKPMPTYTEVQLKGQTQIVMITQNWTQHLEGYLGHCTRSPGFKINHNPG